MLETERQAEVHAILTEVCKGKEEGTVGKVRERIVWFLDTEREKD